MTLFPERQSSDEVAAARRLTTGDIASAWSVTLAGFVLVAAVSFADFACPTDRSMLVAGLPEHLSCECPAHGVPPPH